MWWFQPPLLYFPKQVDRGSQQMLVRWKKAEQIAVHWSVVHWRVCLKGRVRSSLIAASGLLGLKYVRIWNHCFLSHCHFTPSSTMKNYAKKPQHNRAVTLWKTWCSHKNRTQKLERIYLQTIGSTRLHASSEWAVWNLKNSPWGCSQKGKNIGHYFYKPTATDLINGTHSSTEAINANSMVNRQ